MNADRLTQWWGRRNPRERWLMIAVAAVALLFAFDTLLLKPVRIQIVDSKLHLATARSELAKLQQLIEERERAGSEHLRARESDLEVRLSAAESTIHRAQIDLVTPQDMAPQLSAILHKFPELRVVGMVTQPPVPVDENAANNGKGPVNAEARRSMLYQHDLELTLEGRYLELIGYLEQLERAPHKIYWRELDLKVNGQGVPVTKIRFFTLSRGPTWLTL
jgi:MSHA biogenesis protein MshJ